MKLSTYLFLIIHVISLFLPIIHLVEVSHAHNHKNHEIHENLNNNSTPTECKESIFNNDLEKSVSFLNQVYQFIDIPKNTFFQEKVWFKEIAPVLIPKGQDPPFKNTYTSLVGIVKIQIFDVV